MLRIVFNLVSALVYGILMGVSVLYFVGRSGTSLPWGGMDVLVGIIFVFMLLLEIYTVRAICLNLTSLREKPCDANL